MGTTENTTNEELVEIHIDEHTRLERNNAFKTMVMDGELACIDEETGNYFGLNPTGKIIWDLLAKPHTVGQVMTHVAKAFPDENDSIPDDIPPFVAQLASLGIVFVEDTLRCKA